MIERILIAVDDSPDSLAAARVAIAMASALSARLHIVHVSRNHGFDAAIEVASGRGEVGVRRAQSAEAILKRVTGMANTAGIVSETSLLRGEIAPTVLDAARQWQADLLVVGKSARSATGEPYVGTQTRHILEFADQPVLVVPAR